MEIFIERRTNTAEKRVIWPHAPYAPHEASDIQHPTAKNELKQKTIERSCIYRFLAAIYQYSIYLRALWTQNQNVSVIGKQQA